MVVFFFFFTKKKKSDQEDVAKLANGETAWKCGSRIHVCAFKSLAQETCKCRFNVGFTGPLLNTWLYFLVQFFVLIKIL